jgi:hypothetical protein
MYSTGEGQSSVASRRKTERAKSITSCGIKLAKEATHGRQEEEDQESRQESRQEGDQEEEEEVTTFSPRSICAEVLRSLGAALSDSERDSHARSVQVRLLFACDAA